MPTADDHHTNLCTLFVVHSVNDVQSLFFDEEIISVHGGSSHIVFCTVSGKVYATGSNQQGQCGCSGTDDSNQFLKNATLVESLPTCKQVACGYEYSMFLTLNGEVYGTGECQYGQLGIGQKIYTVRKPTKSTWFTDHGIVIEKIACGFYHTLCLSTTGQLYTFGHGHNGQLGVYIPQDPEINVPTWIDTLKDHRIVQLAPGGYHTVVMTSEKRLFVFGNNSAGQLGLKHNNQVNTPTELIFSEGIPRQILCGGEMSSILTTSGDLYSSGATADGQLGLDCASTTTFVKLRVSQVAEVAHGKYQNIVLTTDSKIYLTGITASSGKLKEFKQIDAIGLSTSELQSIHDMQAACGPTRALKLYTGYRDIIFALAPTSAKLALYFSRLVNCTKFYDLEIVAQH